MKYFMVIFYMLFTFMIHVGYSMENEKYPSHDIPECPVCYELCPFHLRGPCNHSICVSCLMTIRQNDLAVEKDSKCPLCRYTIPDFPKFYLEFEPIIYKLPKLENDTYSRAKYQLIFPFLFYYGDLETIKTWKEARDLDLHITGIIDSLPIHFARTRDVIEYLIENGADVNEVIYAFKKPCFTDCAISRATGLGDLERVKILIEKGAHFETFLDYLLIYSGETGNVELMKLWIEKGANINFREEQHGLAVFSYCCMLGHLDAIKFLIQLGVDIHQTENDGHSPFLLTAMEGQLKIIQFFIENKIITDRTQIDIALWCSASYGHAKIVKFLLENGADIETVQHDAEFMWSTPLCMACAFNYFEVVKVLVEKGANVNLPISQTGTLISFCEENGFLEIADYLKEKKKIRDMIASIVLELLNNY